MAAKVRKPTSGPRGKAKELQLPPLNPETDDWPELIRYCNALARRGGLTKEESLKISERVRREIYGNNR
ncbi:MAG: hypothetical protein ACYC41_04300 [Bacillota bacterium]